MIGRKPTLTVALICSKFFAPAIYCMSRVQLESGEFTNDCHRRKIDWTLVEDFKSMTRVLNWCNLWTRLDTKEEKSRGLQRDC
jgi:hypothetical protein